MIFKRLFFKINKKTVILILLIVVLALTAYIIFTDTLHISTAGMDQKPSGNGNILKNSVKEGSKTNAAAGAKDIVLTQNMWVLSSPNQDIAAPGSDISNNVYTRWVKEIFGVKLVTKWTTSDINDYNRINLAMAGNDLPDIIRFPAPISGNTPATLVAQMVKMGQLMPLDKLIDRNASKLSKYIIQENKTGYGEDSYSAVTHAGSLYAFPNLGDNGGDKTILYRKDLLDSIGKKFPENFDELEDVFSTFKAKFPDKICLILTNKFFGMRSLFTANGTLHGHWISDGRGGLIYGGIHPGAKAMLARAAQWYKKGYIDLEFAVKSQMKAFETFTAGDCLMTEMNYYNLFGGPLMAIMENVPEAELAIGPYIKGPKGDSGVYVAPSSQLNTYIGINSKCENAETVIALFNEFLESVLRNEKDLRAKFMFSYPEEPSQRPVNEDKAGIEGINQLKYNYRVQGPGFFNEYIPWYWISGFQLNRPFNTLKDWEEIKRAQDENRLDTLSPSASATYKTARLLIKNEHIWDINVQNMMLNKKYLEDGSIRTSLFSGAPTETMVSMKEYLDRLETETYTKIIMGELPVSAFDSFVTEWKANGGEKMTKEVNKWYGNYIRKQK